MSRAGMVPTWSRLSCIAVESLVIGVPTGIAALSLRAFTNVYLSIENHLRFMLFRAELMLCSQMQTNANSGKEIHTTVPKKSRLGLHNWTVKTLSSVSGCLIKILSAKSEIQNLFFINNFNSSLNASGEVHGTFQQWLG